MEFVFFVRVHVVIEMVGRTCCVRVSGMITQANEHRAWSWRSSTLEPGCWRGVQLAVLLCRVIQEAEWFVEGAGCSEKPSHAVFVATMSMPPTCGLRTLPPAFLCRNSLL
jgi:hypothetical protein